MNEYMRVLREEADLEGYVYEGEYADLDQNNKSIDEVIDATTIRNIIGTAITIGVAIFKLVKQKNLNEVEAACKTYEQDNDDLILLKDFDKKLYKLSFWTKEVTEKEDKESKILKKLLGPNLYDKMRRNKANRFVEYSKDGKFQMGVLYKIENASAVGFSLNFDMVTVSISKNSELQKHKEYYINKILWEHGLLAKDYKKFVDKVNS